jgi:hypothetical protein
LAGAAWSREQGELQAVGRDPHPAAACLDRPYRCWSGPKVNSIGASDVVERHDPRIEVGLDRLEQAAALDPARAIAGEAEGRSIDPMLDFG